MNILELLKPSGKIALIQGNKRVTYSELLNNGLRFGGRLRREGLKAGSYILIFVPLSIELYEAIIGACSIGAAAIFIDFSRGSKFVNDSIARLKPDIVVCDNVTGLARIFYPKIRSIKMLNINSRADSVTVEKVQSDSPAILTFTSGTTGAPKIAVRTHGFLINQHAVLCDHINFDENNIDLGTLPVFTLANLASNMTTLLPDKSYKSKINAEKLAKKMNSEGVTRVISSPALMESLLTYSDFPKLKRAYLGGGPVYPSVLEKMRKDIDLHVVYGSTEAEPISSIRWADVSPEDKMRIASGEGLLVGNIASQIECKIGEDKEILVSGETVLKGYLDGIGDSENKIRSGSRVWHRTGDAGYIDDHGRLWLLGRLSQAIHDALGTLYPFCVECVLDAHFGIRGAVITKSGKRVVVIEKGGANPEKILEILAPQQISSVLEIKKIPMDKRHGAKIDYAKLQNLF